MTAPRPAFGRASVLVPILDEIDHIDATLAILHDQRYDGELEFLLIDGGSTDGTRPILERVAAADPRFRVVDNPARCIPVALNLGLHHARGEYVVRMDAHTRYPADYVAQGVERLRRGDVAWASGPALPHGTGRWSRRVELALTTWLGVGNAAFRKARTEVQSDTGFTGVLRRETLVALGGWDEESLVNEDGELAARVRAAGGRIVCIPEMAAAYVPRDGLRALGLQYWRYGQYRARTSRLHPESMRRTQLLPPGVVLAAGVSLLPGPLGRPARAGLALYGLAVGGACASVVRRAAPRDIAALPLVLLTMHGTWGAGFLRGCVRFGVPWGAMRRAVTPATTAGRGSPPPGASGELARRFATP